MSVDFRLPDVGEGIHEAEIVRWLVREGERVREFDPIVEVQTDKAVVELPAPTCGRIVEIRTPSGTLARVGDVLVTILSDETTLPVDRTQGDNESAPNAGRPRATPGVRHYARQVGVDLTAVVGTGPSGRIQKSDVDSHLQASKPVGAAEMSQVRPRTPTRIPFRGVRRATAEHVKRAAFTAPHVTAFDDCDATELVALRQRWNDYLKKSERRVSYLPFIVKATVSALKAFPYFNARLDEEAQEIELLPHYHIGIAMDTADGLLVPVLKDADVRSIHEIADEIERLTKGARMRSLQSSDLRGSTFTITNMGPIGGLFATPILNYPEVGILAVHQIQRKPVARNEQVVIRDTMTLSLSFDHRVIDGAMSVRFTNHVKHLIENPALLMLEMK